MYWQGEASYAVHDYAAALRLFSGMLSRFPRGVKAADATLKLVVPVPSGSNTPLPALVVQAASS